MGVDHTYRYVNATNVYNKGKADNAMRIKIFYGTTPNGQYTTYNLGEKAKNIVVPVYSSSWRSYPEIMIASNGSKWGWVANYTSEWNNLIDYKYNFDSWDTNYNVKFGLTDTGFKVQLYAGGIVLIACYTT